VDGRDAQAVQFRHAAAQRIKSLCLGWERDVAAYQVDGQFAKKSGGAPGGVAVDDAPGRADGGCVDAGQPQCGAVHHCAVQVAAVENGGAVGAGDRVEVGGGGEVRLAPAALVPAAANDPLAGRGRRGRVGHAGEHLGARGCVGDLHLAAGQRPEREVDVRVAEAGQHQRTRQVDDARPGPASATIAASLPTAAMRSPAMAMAAAVGWAVSSVTILPLRRIRCGAAAYMVNSLPAVGRRVSSQYSGVGARYIAPLRLALPQIVEKLCRRL
jgi:hypothetical protein